MLSFVNIMEDKYQCSVRTSLRLAVYVLSILKCFKSKCCCLRAGYLGSVSNGKCVLFDFVKYVIFE